MLRPVLSQLKLQFKVGKEKKIKSQVDMHVNMILAKI